MTGRFIGELLPHDLEEYLRALAPPSPFGLEQIADEGRRHGFPIIDRRVGALLSVLVRAANAANVLEIGTANGYSGAWLACAIPEDGSLITIEKDPERVEMARRNFGSLGLAHKTRVIAGDAVRLIKELKGPFDLVFNDGDKLHQHQLHDRLIALLRAGGMLVTDNILWSGEVVPGFSGQRLRAAEETQAIASYNQILARDRRLLTSIVPLRDGLALSVKL